MDVITISSVIQHGLIARGRIFTVSTMLPDTPGQLVAVSNTIAQHKGNVIRIEHNQFVNINRNDGVELRLTIESFGVEPQTGDHRRSLMRQEFRPPGHPDRALAHRNPNRGSRNQTRRLIRRLVWFQMKV